MNICYFIIATVSVISSISCCVASSSGSGIGTGRGVYDDDYFQIKSSERPDLCVEVSKNLDKNGRISLQKCKSKVESGIARQMFGVTNIGKLYSSTKPSSCIFSHKKKDLRYRVNCDGIGHKDKNRFMYNFFDDTINLLGDGTFVMSVWKVQEKREVKLQKRSSSTFASQRWTLYFEKDRKLHYDYDTSCKPTTIPTKEPPSSSSYAEFTTNDELYEAVRDYCADESGWKGNSKFDKYG